MRVRDPGDSTREDVEMLGGVTERAAVFKQQNRIFAAARAI